MLITHGQVVTLLTYIQKQGLSERLGEVFCRDYGVRDKDIMLQKDDKRAMDLILKRYGPF